MKNQKAPHSLVRLKASIRALQDRHRERHRPSGFGFGFADRIDYLNPEHWDAVASSSTVFLRRDILRVIERHGPRNIQPRYAIAFRGDKPVAVLAAQLVNVRQEHFTATRGKGSSRLLKRMLAPALQAATAKLDERVIVAGNLLSWGFHGVGFSPEANPVELWPAIAEALYRIRRAERLAGQTNFVMVKDITPKESGLERLHRFSYRPLETEPNMVLTLDPAWRSYDDYLNALDAKYRRNARDQMKKLAAASCSLEPLTELEPQATRLHELYLAVHDNAAVRLVTLPPEFLPALARTMSADFRCTIARRGSTIVGFVTSIRDGDTAVAYYIGFDRGAAAEGLPIYLRLLHATIADAIAWGCKRISLGRTALEPKAALGAKPEPMAIWLRHRVPSLNWLLRGLLGGIPHAEAPERNPFKTTGNPGGREGSSQVQSDKPTVSM
jgi:hypothetical protein